MPTPQTIGGVVRLFVNGDYLHVVGNVTYNLGEDQGQMLVGHDGVHGRKRMPQVPFIECEIRNMPDLDLPALLRTEDADVQLDLPNGKQVALAGASQIGEATGNSEDANIPVRFEGLSAREL